MIYLELDKEDGIDIVSLLGNITVIGESKSISIKATYVDSILEVLLTGFLKLKEVEKVSIELIEEPGEIEFELIGDKIAITYMTDTLHINKSTLQNDLVASVDKLFEEIEDYIKDNRTELIDNLINLRKRL